MHVWVVNKLPAMTHIAHATSDDLHLNKNNSAGIVAERTIQALLSHISSVTYYDFMRQ